MKTPWGSVGPGWDKLVQPLIDYCKLHDIPIAQIKEKFGGLRFYVDSHPPEWEHIVRKAEHASFGICEECGEPGKPRTVRGWAKTLCEQHLKDIGGETLVRDIRP